MLSDELWSKLKEIMLQHQIDDKSNLRMMIEAILYRMPVGCPWRDLPLEFGCWNSIDQPLNRWSSKDKWIKMFKNLIQHPELEWEFIDGSIVHCHWRGTTTQSATLAPTDTFPIQGYSTDILGGISPPGT